MDPSDLSRLQFALTALYHFLFVPLTLGLSFLLVTFLVAFGSNLSALWILIANGWMQSPVGATFNPDTMRMELGSFSDLLFNPVAQAKFVHTVSAGYVVGSLFVLAISSWYMLRGRHLAFARRSFAVAAAFGLASSLSVAVLGDESGFTIAEHQPMKMAAIEGMWHTEPAPASFAALALPSNSARGNLAEIRIPYVLGLIGTHSIDKQLPGIHELVAQARLRIVSGITAYDALQTYRANRKDTAALAVVKARAGDLGYALLLKRYIDDPRKADAAMIDKAAWDTVPYVAPLFWSFRLMVGLGIWFILGGGAIFAAWPLIYATSFSGFYIALFLVLASLIRAGASSGTMSCALAASCPVWCSAWPSATCSSACLFASRAIYESRKIIHKARRNEKSQTS